MGGHLSKIMNCPHLKLDPCIFPVPCTVISQIPMSHVPMPSDNPLFCSPDNPGSTLFYNPTAAEPGGSDWWSLSVFSCPHPLPSYSYHSVMLSSYKLRKLYFNLLSEHWPLTSAHAGTLHVNCSLQTYKDTEHPKNSYPKFSNRSTLPEAHPLCF